MDAARLNDPAGAAPTLVVFLSNGGSLRAWERMNILSREIALYLEFLRAGHMARIVVFSYDARDHERLIEARLDDPTYKRVEVLTPPRWMGGLNGVSAALYSVFGVLWHRKKLRAADWFKTNQMSGSWAAVFAKWTTGRRLLLRQGYSLSRRFKKNGHTARAWLARQVENVSFATADAIAVTSQNVAEPLRAKPKIAPKVNLCPTYVDTTVFTPKLHYRFDEPVVYVGRLEPQKNLINLVLGCRAAGRPLDLIGTGSLEPNVRAIAAEPGPEIRLLGSVPNEQLPGILQDRTVFALTSHHEGLPKVLIEAMCAGLVCVGTRINGIVDLIEDGETGYLVDGFSVEEIAAKIGQAFDERRVDIGQAAAAHIAARFNLENYAREEAAIYSAVAGEAAAVG